MIRRPSPHRAGFTLVELLTVVAIILVLAGLLIAVAGNANYKSSFSRAQTEVKAMETALEGYKADNGTYPRNTDTDTLNPQPASGGTPPEATTYSAACKYLYQSLSGYTAGTRRYMDFKPGQLSTGAATPTDTTYIIDPFGLCYGYSTANASALEQNKANPTTYGYNPTFDLWSTGGYGSGGRQYTKTGITDGTKYNTLWAKNW